MPAIGFPAVPVRPRVVDLARVAGVPYTRAYKALNGDLDSLTADEERRLREALKSFGQQIEK